MWADVGSARDEGMRGGSTCPEKTAHSPSPKSSGRRRWTKCIAYVSRSFLKSDRETWPKTNRSSSGPSERVRCAACACWSSGAASAFRKSERSIGSENRYIVLMRSRSSSVKKSFEPTRATGRYTSRWASSENWSSALSLSFSLIDCDFVLSSFNESISFLFSKMFPSELDSSSNSCCSIASSWIFSSSSAASSVDFCCSSSGCSCWIVIPSSWPSRPDSVTCGNVGNAGCEMWGHATGGDLEAGLGLTEKLTTVMSDATSGGVAGAGLRVARKRRKVSA